MTRANPWGTFHQQMAAICAALLAVCVVGCVLTSIDTNVFDRAVAVAILVACSGALPAYWQHRGRPAMRDAALTLPWAILIAAMLPFPLLVAARLHHPLQDAAFARFDAALGIHVSAIAGWAAHNWIGKQINKTYELLTPMLLTAAVMPALTGRVRTTREFLFANLIGFFVAALVFGLLPAVGPWYYFHFAPSPAQLYCQNELLQLRQGVPYTYLSQGAGVVCFPSFHAFWAILSARALWGVRRLRIVVALAAASILISTLTTGWHYFCDLAAGIVLAVIAILGARRLARG